MGTVARFRSASLALVLKSLEWVAKRRGRGRDLPPHLITGIEGEDAACFYLMRNGYTVTARRWSSGNVRGDLDLVAWRGELLCVIEVKTRTARDMFPAHEVVDAQKRRILRRLTRQYLSQLPHRTVPQVRFDVLGVYLIPGMRPEFEHFEGAFGWSERRPRDYWE
jgi:putative endonuclease